MQAERRYDLDWLRVAGVFLVVIFHTMMIFILEPWAVVYIKDMEYVYGFNPISSFIHIFHMPLMFIIAGMSVKFSLQRRTAKKFLKERFFKLFLPAVFGCLILNPVMTYVYQISLGEKNTFAKHLLVYFTKNPGDLSGIEGGFTPAHFWFLIFLFIFSCIGLPFFLKGKQKTVLFLAKPYCLLLFSVPIALASLTNILDDKNPIPYFLEFVMGYYLMCDDSFREALKRDKWGYAIIGILCACINIGFGDFFGNEILEKFIFALVTQISALSIVFALVGAGDSFWNKNCKLLQYLSGACFPVYIIHMLVNTVVGFFVVRLPIPAMIKFILILVLTVLLSLAVYECIRYGKKRIMIKEKILCTK